MVYAISGDIWRLQKSEGHFDKVTICKPLTEPQVHLASDRKAYVDYRCYVYVNYQQALMTSGCHIHVLLCCTECFWADVDVQNCCRVLGLFTLDAVCCIAMWCLAVCSKNDATCHMHTTLQRVRCEHCHWIPCIWLVWHMLQRNAPHLMWMNLNCCWTIYTCILLFYSRRLTSQSLSQCAGTCHSSSPLTPSCRRLSLGKFQQWWRQRNDVISPPF